MCKYCGHGSVSQILCAPFYSLPARCIMAGLVDSVASFKAHVEKLGLGELWYKFEAMKLTSFWAFAFSCNYIPGAVDDSPLMKDVVTPLLGESMFLKHLFRRLFFESYRLMTSELKQKLEATSDDRPKHMTNAEREARRDSLLPLVEGLDMEGGS